ncbi:DNA-binding domain-containing protein [Oceanicella sp. SM1341]|uniref:HvfC/BufC N-terminal domain-containing protein n=1 Tax=Oceanicella sp. SM1341 TaxID=1548889 RepID=UPI000E4EC28C|nr:DNA-binding domain-containing protein [Oceanicella sp. SM1341]
MTMRDGTEDGAGDGPAIVAGDAAGSGPAGSAAQGETAGSARGTSFEALAAAALRDPALPPPAAAAGFAVWRNNVRASGCRALAATYPALRALTGPRFFEAMCQEVLHAHPPESPVMHEYGAEMAGFVAGFPPLARYPWLEAVARLEWARLRAYHAADAEPLALAALGRYAPRALGALRLTLHPSLALVEADWPVVTIWAETTGRAEPSQPDMARAETALVIRPDWEVQTRVIPPARAAFLKLLAAGGTLGEAAAAAGGGEAELAAGLTEIFSAGAVVGISPA